VRSSDLTVVASAELSCECATITLRSFIVRGRMMRAQVDHLDDAVSTAPAKELELHVDECSISMHGPAAMTLATRIARKRSASTHMRAHNRGLV
jgi:hypothetical protein